MHMQKIVNIIGILSILSGCTLSESPTSLMKTPTSESWQRN